MSDDRPDPLEPAVRQASDTVDSESTFQTRELVDGWAGLWWRADGPNGVLAFDNMQGRGPTGTTDWQRYELSLEIPTDTTNINFGMLMPGRGTAWFDDLKVSIDGVPWNWPGFDFDFESGRLKGFSLPRNGYQVQIDEDVAASGTRSVRIDSPKSNSDAEPIRR